MVSGQWVDYSGSFEQPGVKPGIQDAEFDLKAFVSTIPFLGMEGLVQLDYSVVPLIEARMNDSTNVTIDTFANSLYNNVANTQQMIGLPAAIDDGTFSATYGGISRTTNTFWKSTYVHGNGNVTPTRNLMLQYISQVSKTTGEMPSIGVMGFGTWTLLAQDFTSAGTLQHHSRQCIRRRRKGFQPVPRIGCGRCAVLRRPVLPRGRAVPHQHQLPFAVPARAGGILFHRL